MKHILLHLKRIDPILAPFVGALTPLQQSTDYFADLCEIVIEQQLSEKAGVTIWKRFRHLFPNLTPDALLKSTDKKIRDTGVSWSKVTYLKNVARHAKIFDFGALKDMEDAKVIEELTRIKGIGPWSAEMFLMFSLGREDVFSFGDVGLRNAIKKLYNLRHYPTRKQMERISRKWIPYRTYAARILWQSLVK